MALTPCYLYLRSRASWIHRCRTQCHRDIAVPTETMRRWLHEIGWVWKRPTLVPGGPSMQQGHKFFGISMFASVLIALILSGCAKRPSGVGTPGSTVEPEGQIRLSWERPTTNADGTPL